ncbi:alpha/beta fold hydrolase [Arthrobacter sp. KNU40]|uniref:alpha/beta fold hydrolase n=1 Tax=Arthrobacter sp. KNU40 TaxID=3447965 RepID=UPI003F5EBB46
MIKRSRNGLRFRISGDWSPTDKPIVVFIHGMGGSLHNFAGVFRELARTMPVLTVELPGHGRSEDNVSSWNLVNISEAIANAIDEIAIDRERILVGHSLGAFVAAQVAILAPETTRRIIAISGDLFHVASLLRHPIKSIFVDPLRMIAIGGALITATARPSDAFCMKLNTPSRLHMLLWPFLNPSLTRKEEAVGESFREQGGNGALRLLRLAEHVSLEELYRECPVPVVFVVGEHDPLSTDSDRHHVVETFGPDALIAIPVAAHWPHVEDVKGVAAALRRQCLEV